MIDMNKGLIRERLLTLTKQGKLYLLTAISDIASYCNVEPAEVMSYVQECYLTSDIAFKYDLSKTRTGIKIVAIERYVPYTIDINNQINSEVSNNLAIYMLSQFGGKINNINISEIISFYLALLEQADKIQFSSDVLYLAIDKNKGNVYDINGFSNTEIDYMLDLILTHGYAFKNENDIIIWKTYSPSANITKEDLVNAFTVIRKQDTLDFDTEEKEAVKEEIVEVEMPTKEITVKDAFSLIAKEFGMSLTEDDSSNKLEELVATTNELILNFDALPDWEKLRSWGQFVTDWKAIMGEAINDRN